MKDWVKEKCDLLIKNREAIHDKFKFEDKLMSVSAALIYTGEGREADVERLKECRKILRKNSGVFSKFRASVELALLTKMEMSGDPEKYINDVKDVYKKLVKTKTGDNAYTILAAMMVCEQGKTDSADELIERYSELMKLMNDQHPMLTSTEDISYAMLLALSDRPVKLIINDMEECLEYFKKTCKIGIDSNSLQGLCEILAMSDGDKKAACDRITGIYKKLKEKKAEFGSSSQVLSLAALADIEAEPEVLADEIFETSEYLSGISGFEDKTLEKENRLMFSAILVGEGYGKDSPTIRNTYINSALEIIKAKQTAMIVNILINMVPSILSGLVGSDEETTEDTLSEGNETKKELDDRH